MLTGVKPRHRPWPCPCHAPAPGFQSAEQGRRLQGRGEREHCLGRRQGQASCLCTGAEQPVHPLVPEFAVQLPQDLLQRLGQGKHHLPHGQSSVASQSALSVGLSQPRHCAWTSPAGPRLSCSPGPARPLAWGASGPCLGRQERAEVVFCMGRGEHGGRALGWPGQL